MDVEMIVAIVYLCGALLQRQQLPPPPPPQDEPSHLWRRAGPPEPRTGPTSPTRRQALGWDGATLRGVGPLASPGHAGRDAAPESAAVGKKGEGGGGGQKNKAERRWEKTDLCDLEELKRIQKKK